MTGMSRPSTTVFTTERSAGPCRRRRAEGWRACNARKAAPDAWRLVARVSVEDTGLQRRNLAEKGTHNACERDETAWRIINSERHGNFAGGEGAHRCLGRGASLSFRVNTPQNVPLERCLEDNRGSDLRRFARKCVRERDKLVVCVFHRPTHTNAVTEIHDRLCAAKDHILIVPAYLDYYRSRGRTP